MVIRRSRAVFCWFGVGLLSGLWGCGDKNNPLAISALDLKPPGQLSIRDNGNGKVTLSWLTTNPEDDFEGYNIYGAKLTDADLKTAKLTQGQPLKLLDDSGEPVAGVADTLKYFSFDNKNPYVISANAPAPIVVDEEQSQFASLPIYHMNPADPTDPLLPTCSPVKGTCVDVVKEDSIVSGAAKSFGPVTYTIEGLTVGSQYCFMVFSVQDGGKEVSQSSSTLQCVTPKYRIGGTVTMPSSGFGGHYFDLRTLLTTCTTKCDASLTYASTSARTATQINNVYTGAPASFESYSTDTTNVFLATGQNAFIRPMGYFAGGFDETMPAVPKLVYSATDPDQGGGYSKEGQSVLLQSGYLYAIAVGDSAQTDTTKFNYHWLWISSSNASVTRGTAFTFDLMLAANQQ